MQRKKSKYRHVVINKKRYYFYKISWVDITADGGHATAEEFNKFECSRMITFGYIYKRTKKFIWTFASYDEKDEAYSDRNVFPIGCITGLERLNVESREDYCGRSLSDGSFVCLFVNFSVLGVTFKIGA